MTARTRERPAVPAGRSQIQLGAGIERQSNTRSVEVWSYPKPEPRSFLEVEPRRVVRPRYFDTWCAQRDAVQGRPAGQRAVSRSAHNGMDQPGALGSRCWVPPFGLAIELGLVDGDWLAIPVAEVAA